MNTCRLNSVATLPFVKLNKTQLPFNVNYTKKCTKLSYNCYCCASSSSNSSNAVKNQNVKRNRGEEDGKVKCHVEVISWRERRIKGQIVINADIDSVWNALTDYERLADFIPNLISSGKIPCPHPGRIWLEQRGLQRSLYWHIEARVVLDLQEILNSSYDRELRFCMVDGDFKKFEGKWSVESERSSHSCIESGSVEKRIEPKAWRSVRSSTTILFYEVNVIPRINFPAIFLERIICSDLPVNLQALACRAEKNFQGNQISSLLTKTLASISSGFNISSAITDEEKVLPGELKESNHSSWGVFGKVCNLDRPCIVDEVHLRRFDGLLENGGVHRCVVASITVKTPVRELWNVLTDYERLPEIVPNLAISKILSRDNNKVRILQEGCKGLLYMVLHARVVLDLCEELEQEISFEQVEGDFSFFQGKWLLEQLGNHHTLLKYSVESKMHKNSFLSEAIMEEVIYEDLPSNLCAIRDYVEKMATQNSLENLMNAKCAEEQTTAMRNDNDFVGQNISRQRPRVPGLQRDIEVLKQELLNFIVEYGQEGFMPMRKQLRKHGRVDIEKAITRMGGFRRIASVMNLSLAYKHRKPKGYWDNLENLQEEINRFQRSWGMDPSFMPSRKSFEQAGRYDVARALEKWGGLHEVSRLLSLKVRHPNRQGNISKDKKNDNAATGVSHSEDGKLTSEPYVSQNTDKWLTKLKDLDINWVE